MFNSNIFYNFLFAIPPDNRASKMSKKFRLYVLMSKGATSQCRVIVFFPGQTHF